MHKKHMALFTTVAILFSMFGVRHVRADMSGGALIDANGTSTQAQARMRYVATGDTHTCVVLHSGSVKCFGAGGYGQLGNETGSDSGDSTSSSVATTAAIGLGLRRTARAVAVGTQHSCALLDDFTVKCWGRSSYGQLGYGNKFSLGDEANEMGVDLAAIDLGTGRTAQAIAVGALHSCALLDNFAVKCWGISNYGQLGYGSTQSLGDGPGEMGNALPSVTFAAGRSARAIAAGKHFTCALLDNASVVCWGANGSGQLGQGSTASRGDGVGASVGATSAIDLGSGRTALAIAAGDDHACAIVDNGSLRCWGNGANGRLGTGATANIGDGANEMGGALNVIALHASATVRSIAAGGVHTCAVLSNGEAKCFGDGSTGRLGYENQDDVGDSIGEVGTALSAINLGVGRTVLAISAGLEHTCALLDDSSLKCWGRGDNGRRGSSNMNDVGANVGDMGDTLVAVALGAGETMNSATEPTAPQTVVGVVGDTSVSVSWNEPINDGGSAVTDYVVEHRLSSDTTWSTFSDGVATTLSATVTGLVNTNAYVFRVSALNAINTGAPSVASVAVTPNTTTTTTTSTTTTTTTTTTAPAGAVPVGTTSTSTTTPPSTIASPTSSAPTITRTISALVVPAFTSYSSALRTKQQQLLQRFSRQLRAGDSVSCVGYSQPNALGMVTSISVKRARAVCAFLAAKVGGIRTSWVAQTQVQNPTAVRSAALSRPRKPINLARTVVVTATAGS